GVNIGAANNPIYTTSTLNDGDDVYCTMTSSETCVTNSPAMSNTVNIIVNPVPVVPSVDVLCNGTNGAGVITVTDPIGAEYTYSIDGVVFQTETQFIDVANGTYTITIDQSGCTNVSSEVLVDCSCDNPTTLTISANSGIACSAEDFTLNGNMFGGNASEVTVTHDGAGVLEQSVFTTSPFDIVYIPDATDLNQTITFTVLTDDPAGDLCDAISEQFTITVYESPVVNLPESVNACEGEEFTYTLTDAYDYVIWMGALESNTYTANYTFSGDYQVWVWVENEYCAAQDTMTVVVTVCSDIDQALINGRFDIYPNPTRENCQLSVSDYQGELSYSVVDVQGKVIISKQLNVQSDYVEDINVEDFVPGMYFIRLTTHTETINFKLIKN
ncbi:MAG: T9SS type A sorting domain-containing protein, partial [Bacteroidales bacterium]|nr:T9SS type A sorting domain-containing protein [Bacteroidales bacterium]